MCIAIVGVRHAAKALLSGGVPDLQLDAGILQHHHFVLQSEGITKWFALSLCARYTVMIDLRRQMYDYSDDTHTHLMNKSKLSTVQHIYIDIQ